MKTAILVFFILILLSVNAKAVAPYGIKGQSQSQTLYSNVHQFPNNQVTNVGGINALVETGNNNILVNPSYEHSTPTTGWTLSGCTAAPETTEVAQGKKALKITCASQILSLFQDSTLYAGKLAGNSVRKISAYATASGVKLCSRSAGVVSATNCIDVPVRSNYADPLTLPAIYSATSNGLEIKTDSAFTGDIFVDAASIEPLTVAQVDQSRIAGESFFGPVSGCSYNRASATIGPLTPIANCPGPTIIYSSMGQWQTTDSDLPRQIINNLPAGVYKAKFLSNSSLASAGYTGFAINDGTTTCSPVYGSGITGVQTLYVECVFTYNSPGNRVFELYAGTVGGTSVSIDQGRTALGIGTKFILEYFGSGSVYTSTNADTDWASCNFSTLAWQGLGTVTTTNLRCKRQGSDLLMQGFFLPGTTTASEARIPLPTWNGSQLTSASNTAGAILGRIIRGVGGAPAQRDYSVIAPSSQTYLNIGLVEYSVADNSFVAKTGSSSVNSGETVGIEARIPIAGWTNSNVIIGSFAEVVTTPGVTKPASYSFSVSSAGVVSNDIGDLVNGNCTIPTPPAAFDCQFNSGKFSSTPNCVIMIEENTNSAAAKTVHYKNGSSTAIAYLTQNGSTATAYATKVICHGERP